MTDLFNLAGKVAVITGAGGAQRGAIDRLTSARDQDVRHRQLAGPDVAFLEKRSDPCEAFG